MNLLKTSNLTILFSSILQTYFINLYSIVLIYDWPTNSKLNTDYINAIEIIIKDLEYRNVVLQCIQIPNNSNDHFNFTQILHANVELGCQGYIVISNLITFINEKYNVQQYSKQRLRDTIFLFLSDKTDYTEFYQQTQLQLYPSHILVSPSSSQNNAFELTTQKFSGKYDRFNSLVVDTFYLKGTFKKYSNLYYDKFSNLHGRVLNVSAITYLPYSITQKTLPGIGNFDEWNSTEEKNIFYDGSEARIIIELCKRKNCSIKVKEYPGDFWGVVSNGTADGQVGAVYYHEVEFAIGCMYKWFYNESMDLSRSIVQSGSSLLVPPPVLLSFHWTPFLPFSLSCWIVVILVIGINTGIYYYVRIYSEILFFNVKRSETKTSIYKIGMEVFAVYLQQSTSRFLPIKKYIAVRMISAVFLLSGVILENSYSGSLKSILTVPTYINQIDTVHQFVKSAIKWGAPQPAWAMTVKTPNENDRNELIKLFELRQADFLRNASFSRNYGIGIERLHSGNYAFNNYIKADALEYLAIMKEDIAHDYTNAYTIRGWPYMKFFDKLSMEIVEHGLYHCWETQVIHKYLDFKTVQRLNLLKISHIGPKTPKQLSIMHISGHLNLLIWGLVVALIVFVIELIYAKRCKNN